jgi:hypothetical protein
MVLYYIEIEDILERAVPEAEDISVAKITETVLEPSRIRHKALRLTIRPEKRRWLRSSALFSSALQWMQRDFTVPIRNIGECSGDLSLLEKAK